MRYNVNYIIPTKAIYVNKTTGKESKNGDNIFSLCNIQTKKANLSSFPVYIKLMYL